MNLVMLILTGVLVMLRPLFIGRSFGKHIDTSYQAFGHICVGWLFALWWVNDNRTAGIFLLVGTIVEVICAVISARKKHGKT